MSSSTPISPFDVDGENWWSNGISNLAKRICGIGNFARGLTVQMKFGELTRAQLRLLRFHLKENVAECDWLARLPDPWDAGIRPDISDRHTSIQALSDAVQVRRLLFDRLPDLDAAYLRIYRQRSVHLRELIISGHVHRETPSFRSVHSIAMRAKLLGFRFSLENDALRATCELSNMELVQW